VELAQTTIRAQDLLELRVGDVITTSHDIRPGGIQRTQGDSRAGSAASGRAAPTDRSAERDQSHAKI